MRRAWFEVWWAWVMFWDAGAGGWLLCRLGRHDWMQEYGLGLVFYRETTHYCLRCGKRVRR